MLEAPPTEWPRAGPTCTWQSPQVPSSTQPTPQQLAVPTGTWPYLRVLTKHQASVFTSTAGRGSPRLPRGRLSSSSRSASSRSFYSWEGGWPWSSPAPQLSQVTPVWALPGAWTLLCRLSALAAPQALGNLHLAGTGLAAGAWG